MKLTLFRNRAAHGDRFRDVDPLTLDAHTVTALGFKHVINLRGGMIAYNAVGLAVERSP